MCTNVWSTASTSRRRAASSTSRMASSAVDAIGFSTKTCLPAISALIASSKWLDTGVAMATASNARIAQDLLEIRR